jgi:tripeptidyl-peptidase-1
MKLLLLVLLVSVVCSTMLVKRANEHAFKHHNYVQRANRNALHEVMFSVNHNNIDKLEKELYKVADPKSPSFRNHWSLGQVEDFTRNEASTKAVRDYFEANGIMEATDKAKSGDLYLYATAPLSKWEELLGAEFHEYIDANTGKKIVRSIKMTIPEGLAGHIFHVSKVTSFPALIEHHGQIHEVHETAAGDTAAGAFTTEMAGHNPRSLKAYMNHPKIKGDPSLLTPKSRVRVAERMHLADRRRRSLMQGSSSDAGSGSGSGVTRKLAGLANPSNPYIHPTFLNDYLGVDQKLYSGQAGSQSVFETIKQNYSPEDLATFQRLFNVTVKPASYMGVPGFNSTNCPDLNNCAEANLDIQYIMAVGGNIDTVYYYDDSEAGFMVQWAMDIGNREDAPLVTSISYGAPEMELPDEEVSIVDTELIKMGLRGITVVVSSGDNGANGQEVKKAQVCTDYVYNPAWPASCPYVLTVGATQGPEVDKPETACSSNTGGAITSGGGFSSRYPRPAFQDTAVATYVFMYSVLL